MTITRKTNTLVNNNDTQTNRVGRFATLLVLGGLFFSSLTSTQAGAAKEIQVSPGVVCFNEHSTQVQGDPDKSIISGEDLKKCMGVAVNSTPLYLYVKSLF